MTGNRPISPAQLSPPCWVYASLAFSASRRHAAEVAALIEHSLARGRVASIEGRMERKSNLQQRLAALLREAERAHGDYERSLGHRDDDWPDWYAAYIAERLSGDFR